ncbi:hypothetical protein HK102_003727, partial [Quaeritorhiza haematococci]
MDRNQMFKDPTSPAIVGDWGDLTKQGLGFVRYLTDLDRDAVLEFIEQNIKYDGQISAAT